MHKIGCKQEALDGYISLVNKLKKKDEHTLSEIFYCSQAYYRISQLHLELKFLDKAGVYMELYEKLQNDYLSELNNLDDGFEANIRSHFLHNQFLKRKAWMHCISWETDKALKILTDVYKNEKQ